ncbi:MAG: tetratricopeptide repeat protein, partial [bacterium]
MSRTVEQLESRFKGLENAETPEKVDILVDLAWNIGYDDLERAFKINEQAGSLAEQLSYEYGLARVNRNRGFYYYSQSDFKTALRRSMEALSKFEELGEKNEQANTLGITGLIYWSLGNFELALDHLHKGEKFFLETGNRDRLPWAYTTLGGVYQTLGDYDKSLRYHKESLKLFRANKDRLGEARALSGLGTVYESKKQYAGALRHHQTALKIFQEIGNELGESRAYNDLGSIHQLQGNFEYALKYHESSLRIRQKLRQKNAEITSLLNLGKLYNEKGDPARALEYLQKALAYAEETAAKPKLYLVHQALSQAYERLKDLEKALEHLKAFERIKNQVLGDEASSKLKNLEIQFEVEKSQKETEIHRLRNIELKGALDNLRATQVQLVETEKMAVLGQITAGIAHEINNPVGVVKSAADISMRGLERIKQAIGNSASISEVVNSNAYLKSMEVLEKNNLVTLSAVERIADMINSLKNFARLDESEYKRADVHEGIESTLTLIRHEIANGIKIEKNFGQVPPFNHYPNQLNQVFMTLLRNSVQAIDGEGIITIKTEACGDLVHILISDTGRGMSPEVRESLFDLGFTIKHSRVGLGMGLYSAYTIVKRPHGTIDPDE